MNITEEDVRSELLDGWEVCDVNKSIESGSSFSISKDCFEIRLFRVTFKDIDFRYGMQQVVSIKHADFLSGNYDLTEISEHYSDSEWSAIIGMCRSIVRLIAGEKQPEKSLKEQASEMLGTLPGVNGIEVSPTVITFFAGAAKREIVTTGVIDHDPFTGACKHTEFDVYDPEYREAYKAAAALLTPESTPEKSLEEKVRGWIDDERTFVGDKITVEPHQVKIVTDQYTATITEDCVYEDLDRTVCFVGDLNKGDWNKSVQELFRNIAAELKTHLPSPTYTELEQRVRELEKDSDIWKGLAYTEETRADRAEEKYELAKRELSELRESHIQQGSVEGHKIEKLQGRITELEAQLQDYVSPADHEREMRNNEELLAIITKQRDDCNAQAKQYLSWFHREYAKNAGVSQ